jgi:hypothetical protein
MHNRSTAMNQSLNKLNPQHYFEIHTPLQKQAEGNEQKRSETTTGGTNAPSKTTVKHHKTGKTKKY